MLLRANGFRIIDIGKDVYPARFVETAIMEGAGFIGVSSLITLTIPYIREIKGVLYKEALAGIKVIAGGAAFSRHRQKTLMWTILQEMLLMRCII